jgi:cell division protein FtsX
MAHNSFTLEPFRYSTIGFLTSSTALVLNPVFNHWNVATVDATDFYVGEKVATGSN